ncbi:MAG: hypothetical protein JWR61_4003 [Ferruginibacter sp.]|nr:hypothetical protein [Ferruginibacter sp.]
MVWINAGRCYTNEIRPQPTSGSVLVPAHWWQQAVIHSRMLPAAGLQPGKRNIVLPACRLARLRVLPLRNGRA